MSRFVSVRKSYMRLCVASISAIDSNVQCDAKTRDASA